MKRGEPPGPVNCTNPPRRGGAAFRAISFGLGYTGGMTEVPKRRRIQLLALLLAACALVTAFASYRKAAQNSANYELRKRELQDLKVQVEEIKSHIKPLKPGASESP
jgi:hypothetical protein